MDNVEVGFGEDLLMEILSRLPVKSLLLFRCVCKFWYALIKNPDFITKHLQRNLTPLIQGNAPLFAIGNGPPLWISSKTTTTPLDDGAVPSIDPNCLPFSDHGKAIPNTILGPVNGIYCAILLRWHTKAGIIYLCNPALREVKAIPKVPVPMINHDPLLFHETDVFVTFGFGYDSNVNDYKLVAITSFWDFVQPPRQNVFIYTLTSNSWREIKCDTKMLFPGHRSIKEPWFVMNHGNGGVAHWLVEDSDHTVIVSFDFVKEVFRMSNLPGTLDIIRECDVGRRCYIAVLNDESILLIVVLCPPEDFTCERSSIRTHEKCLETWMMKNELSSSWIKLFSTEYLPEFQFLAGFHKNSGELLFVGRISYYHTIPSPNEPSIFTTMATLSY